MLLAVVVGVRHDLPRPAHIVLRYHVLALKDFLPDDLDNIFLLFILYLLLVLHVLIDFRFNVVVIEVY